MNHVSWERLAASENREAFILENLRKSEACKESQTGKENKDFLVLFYSIVLILNSIIFWQLVNEDTREREKKKRKTFPAFVSREIKNFLLNGKKFYQIYCIQYTEMNRSFSIFGHFLKGERPYEAIDRVFIT